MRKWSFKKPLLFKLTSLALVVTLLSVGVTTFFVARFAHATLEKRTRSDLYSDAQIISLVLQDSYDYVQLPREELERKLAEIGQASNRFFRIRDGRGFSLASTIPSELRDHDLIIVKLSIDEDTNLEVAILDEEISGLLDSLIHGSILIAVLVAVAALSIVFFLNRAITNPIKDLLVVVQRLQEKEFGRRVLVRSTDEIGQLGRAFNELSEILEELFFTLRDREGKLETVLSSMDDGVMAVNMSRTVILANKASAEMFHLEPEVMIGKNQFKATKHEELCRLLEETMDTKESVLREIRMRPGSERTLAITSSPLEDQNGNIIGAVAVMRDITSLRHLEQMRQEFVANVSHELRTPLTSIKGFSETLLNGNLDDRKLLERFLGIINDETERMIVLINDLLDLSRIESGKQPFNQTAVDMQRIFADTILMLQSKAEEKQITLESNIYSPIFVEGDEKLLKQVAINLVDNGVKYTPEGGKVWVQAEQGLDSVEFFINDNGLGISSEHLDRLFERFYRVDKGRARHMGGTGLGLAITKHIIDKHKGTIAVESRVGKGTKIRLTLKKAK